MSPLTVEFSPADPMRSTLLDRRGPPKDQCIGTGRGISSSYPQSAGNVFVFLFTPENAASLVRKRSSLRSAYSNVGSPRLRRYDRGESLSRAFRRMMRREQTRAHCSQGAIFSLPMLGVLLKSPLLKRFGRCWIGSSNRQHRWDSHTSRCAGVLWTGNDTQYGHARGRPGHSGAPSSVSS